MAAGEVNLPPGFELDEAPKLPDGFVLDEARRRTPMQMGAYAGERAKQEAVLGLITQPAGTVAAGARGLYGMATREDPSKTVAAQEAVERRLTYEPRTEGGAAALSEIGGVLGLPSQLAGAAGQGVYGLTGSPTAGAATDVALQAIPSILARGARGPVERARAGAESRLAGDISRESWKDETLKRGLDAGFAVPPKNTVVSWLLRAAAGKPELVEKLRNTNQPVLDRIGRQEAGLGPNEPLSKETLKAARERMAAPYEDVANLSPVAKSMLRGWKSANAKASQYYDEFKRTGTVEAQENAQKFKEDSRHYQEVMLEEVQSKINELWSAGKTAEAQRLTKLLPRLKEAQIAIAKNYTVERSLRGGEVDAGSLGREYTDGQKLSGGLETIGRMSADRNYGQFLKPGMDPIAPKLHSAIGVGMSGAGLHVGGAEMFGQGIPLVRGPAARMAASRTMQTPETTMPRYQVGAGVRLSDIATKRPLNLLIPSLFQRAPEPEQ